MGCKCCCGTILFVFLLFPIGFIGYVEFSKSADKQKIQCFVDYLKDKSEESFNAVEEYRGDRFECERYISDANFELVDERFDKMFYRMNSDSIPKCVFDDLKTQDFYFKNLLLIEVLEYTRISWKFWKYFDRNARLGELEKERDDTENNEERKCQERRREIGIHYGTTEKEPEVTTKRGLTTFGINKAHTTLAPIPTTTTPFPVLTTDLIEPTEFYIESDSSEVSDEYHEITTTTIGQPLSEDPPRVVLIDEEGSGDDDTEESEENYRDKRDTPSNPRLRPIINNNEDFDFQA